MSLGRVLVEEFQPEVLKWLRERVDLVVVNPWVEPQRWDIEAARVDAVISRKGQITREHMEKAGGRLKIIARTGVGVDPSRVDLEAAKELKVWVTNQPGSNAVSVAELVFGQMIALVRHTHAADRAVKDNRWSDYLKFIGTELAGKTIGIVGMGNIGARMAIRARAFEMDFLVYDPYIPESHVTALGGKWVGLNELLADSDFVTIHCPLNRETRGMIGAKELGLMKPSAFLINAARGGIVDEAALCADLAAGQDRRRGVGRDRQRAAGQGSSVVQARQCAVDAAFGRGDAGSFRARRVGRGRGSDPRARKQTAEESGGGCG